MKIYEKIEKNEIKEWSYLGSFEKEDYNIFFPPIIKSFGDEKFIFFAQNINKSDVRNNLKSITFFKLVELWKKNKTLSRSLVEFPIDLRKNIEESTDPIEDLWILQF